MAGGHNPVDQRGICGYRCVYGGIGAPTVPGNVGGGRALYVGQVRYVWGSR